MHKFDYALIARSLEPLVSWDDVSLRANIEVDIWDGVMLGDSAIATC